MGLTTYQGTVAAGRVVLPPAVILPDGATVLVTVLDEWTPTPEDVSEAKLLGESPEFYKIIEGSLREVRDGHVMTFGAMLDELSD